MNLKIAAKNLRVITNNPVALNSPDHLHPYGTKADNSVNAAFNSRLYLARPRMLQQGLLLGIYRVLDLGCAGGGFVKSLLEGGDFAVGIEGSDFSKVHRRAAWNDIPDCLFTADITEPFLVIDDLGPIQFDVITLWEVFEHIHWSKLPALFHNIRVHLSKEEGGGRIIASVSTGHDSHDGVEYHQTVRPREWWLEQFNRWGFYVDEKAVEYFDGCWVRGGDNAPNSFHVVLRG